jgi:hypothetical protein
MPRRTEYLLSGTLNKVPSTAIDLAASACPVCGDLSVVVAGTGLAHQLA